MPMTIGRTAVGWSVLADEQVPKYVIPVQGGTVTMRLRRGDCADILVDVVQRYDATVERVRQGQLDDWSYNRRKVRENSSVWSEHAAGTAIDLNALQHGRGARGTYSTIEVAAIRHLLDLYEGVVAWGGDFGAPGHTGHVPDEMHFQIAAKPGDPAIARVAAKIRALSAAAQEDDVRPRLVKLKAGSGYQVWLVYPSGLTAYIETPAAIDKVAKFWDLPRDAKGRPLTDEIDPVVHAQLQRIKPD